MFKKINLSSKILLVLALTLVLSACTNSNSLNNQTNSLNNQSNNINNQTNNMDNNNTNNENQRTVLDQEDLAQQYQYVVLKTNQGDIKIKLYTDKTPITANNFLNLAQEGFYNDTKFHRIIEGFMIQGGDPLTKDDEKKNSWGTGSPGYVIPNEDVQGVSNVEGTISMANAGPDTGGSQFFINTADNVALDFDKQPLQSQHSVFGEVVEGMDVVNKIESLETDPRDRPLEDAVITDVELLKD
jgi:cyclophilin family peptidyl-prolyl cis-trans isomerase